MLKIVYADDARLMRNGEELKFKDRVHESKPDIIGLVETKLIKDVKSHAFFRIDIR